MAPLVRSDQADYDKSVDFESSSTSTWRVPKRAEAVAKAIGNRIRYLRPEKGSVPRKRLQMKRACTARTCGVLSPGPAIRRSDI